MLTKLIRLLCQVDDEVDLEIDNLIKPPRIIYAEADWKKLRVSNGDARRHKLVEETCNLRS